MALFWGKKSSIEKKPMARAKRGLRFVPSFDEYTRADMQKYMRDRYIVEGYIPLLMEGWKTSRDECIRKILEYQTIIDFQKADRARNDASNYYLINSVYLSDAVEGIIEEPLKLIGRQHVIDEQIRVENYSDESVRNERREIRQKKPAVIRQLKAMMRTEISVGYYTEKPANSPDSIGANSK